MSTLYGFPSPTLAVAQPIYVSSDPSTGAGQAGTVGQVATDGTYWYGKHGTANTDWTRYSPSGQFTVSRWDDLFFPVQSINPAGSAAPPTVNNTNGLLEFPATGTTLIAFQIQMPHSWAEGTIIRPHVHWRKKTAAAGNVVWRFEYDFANVGALFSDVYTPVNASTVAPVSADDGSALRHLITPFGDLSMTGKTLSCMGHCRISRLGDDGADTYAGVAQLSEFDIHYQIDATGSTQEYIK
jgi:hypothetical protein